MWRVRGRTTEYSGEEPVAHQITVAINGTVDDAVALGHAALSDIPRAEPVNVSVDGVEALEEKVTIQDDPVGF